MKWEIPISGMHCRSCELLLEKSVKEVAGVGSVKAFFRKGKIDVHWQGNEPAWEIVKSKIQTCGYKIGASEGKPWLTRQGATYGQLLWAIVIVIFLYGLLRLTGLTSFNLANGKISYPFILLIGLVAGLSTCMAVVGGLVVAFSASFAEKHPQVKPYKKLQPHLFFNLGRIAGYFLLGGVLGLVGDVFSFSNTWWALISFAVALVMIFLGLKLTEISPRLASWSLTLPTFISRWFYKSSSNQKAYSHWGTVAAGSLTFFLPCGFTQAMQIYALASGNFWSGSMIMGLFALGTAPALFGLGALTSVFSGKKSQLFFKVVGVGVIILAIININSGLRLLGWSGLQVNSITSEQSVDQDWKSLVEKSGVNIVDGVQIVKMTETARGYTPNQFVVKRGLPVKWVIDAQSTFSCASSLLVPALKIQKNLTPGENIIEFIPQKVGRLNFSCSMGMYGGQFEVIE